MTETHWWPRGLSSDSRRVSSVCLPHAEGAVRVLLPPRADDHDVRWRDLVEPFGLTVTPELSWKDIEDAAGLFYDYSNPSGDASPLTVMRLLQALEVAESCWTARLVFWGVYAEEDAWEHFGATKIARAYADTRWHDGNHLISDPVSLDALGEFSGYPFLRFPGAVLPESRDFLIASEGYPDSLYVSGSANLVAAIKESGLETVDVDPGGILSH